MPSVMLGKALPRTTRVLAKAFCRSITCKRHAPQCPTHPLPSVNPSRSNLATVRRPIRTPRHFRMPSCIAGRIFRFSRGRRIRMNSCSGRPNRDIEHWRLPIRTASPAWCGRFGGQGDRPPAVDRSRDHAGRRFADCALGNRPGCLWPIVAVDHPRSTQSGERLLPAEFHRRRRTCRGAARVRRVPRRQSRARR